MMKIEAIVRPEKVEAVRRTLSRIGYPGMMVTEMEGHGQQKGLHADWPPEMRVHFIPKSKLEIVVDNQHWKNVVKAIVAGSRTGEKGDGKIFISEIVDAVRIRTGERGLKAISERPSERGTAKGKAKAGAVRKKKLQLVKAR
jgi:nitrogen regulatory protein P-II 1